MLADTRDIRITASDKKELTDNFATMPPHPEVPVALKKLRGAGFQLYTLTDNLLEIQGRQLKHGGIIELFDNRFSVDNPEVRRHKPAPEAYAYVERQLRVATSDLFLIASHTWDTLGAIAAGWGAALIKRPGNDVLSVGPQPTLVGRDLDDVANQLIRRFAEAGG
jgi:2-haloacid dehalogenase